ncbi:MAG: YncE family protein, partial [Gammaproteobacteria bacterium]|nr:YncE family protein [Gammaproteobacteria bacterium]
AGRGHHVACFTGGKRMVLTNLLSGNALVMGNDASDSDTYLKTISEINLCEPEKEKDGTTGVPNNAFPHGLVYSKVTDRVYNLNNGYGTIAVINTETAEIESRIPLKGCSNLLDSPCGNFVIGKGADRKGNPDHVIGKLAVIDVKARKEVNTIEPQDYYPSCYRFSPDGKKLYVTSAATGKGAQKDNLKINTVQVYDATKLPELPLIKEVEVGVADVSRRPIAFTVDSNNYRVFVPNPTDGTVSILDGTNDTLLNTIKVGKPGAMEINFSYLEMSVYGA